MLFDEHSDERPMGREKTPKIEGFLNRGSSSWVGQSPSSLDEHGPGRETGRCMWGLGVWAGQGAIGQRLQMRVLAAAAPDVL